MIIVRTLKQQDKMESQNHLKISLFKKTSTLDHSSLTKAYGGVVSPSNL